MTSFDTPTTITSDRPATADTVPIEAVEAADRYSRGSETHVEQAERLISQLRDDIALGRVQTDKNDIAKTFGLMHWRLCSLGYVISAMQEECLQ